MTADLRPTAAIAATTAAAEAGLPTLAGFHAACQRGLTQHALPDRPAACLRATALRNIAGMGQFSIDRTIGDHVRRVWAA